MNIDVLENGKLYKGFIEKNTGERYEGTFRYTPLFFESVKRICLTEFVTKFELTLLKAGEKVINPSIGKSYYGSFKYIENEIEHKIEGSFHFVEFTDINQEKIPSFENGEILVYLTKITDFELYECKPTSEKIKWEK